MGTDEGKGNELGEMEEEINQKIQVKKLQLICTKVLNFITVMEKQEIKDIIP